MDLMSRMKCKEKIVKKRKESMSNYDCHTNHTRSLPIQRQI